MSPDRLTGSSSPLLDCRLLRRSPRDPDALYAREMISPSPRAAAIWADRLQKNPSDFEAAWKLARARYWLGGQGAGSRTQGAARSRNRGRAGPPSPSNRTVPKVTSGSPPTWARSPSRSDCVRDSSIAATSRTSFSSCSKLDPAFQHGSADRALGRWYFKVPGLFGGSNTEVGRAPAEVTDLQPQQQLVAVLPRRNADRHGPQSRMRAPSSRR